jgi:D-xylose transport system permease protein
MTTTTGGPPPAGPATEPKRSPAPLAGATERLRSGELGAWPVVIGLLVIWIVFQSLNDRFLTPQNLSNLALQMAAAGTISVGVVLVLLLGEIDLSVGSVAGLGAAILAVLSVRQGVDEVVAFVIVLLVGAVIGSMHGFIFAAVGVPAFVVTLAGNLGWLGLQLYLLFPQGTINIPYDGFVAKLTHTNLPDAVGWLIAALVVGAYAAAVLVDGLRRQRAGLPARSMTASILRIVGLAVVIGAAVAVLNDWQEWTSYCGEPGTAGRSMRSAATSRPPGGPA